MNLTEKQVARANRFHAILKTKGKEYFKENNIVPCSCCDKTGLRYTKMTDVNGEVYATGWDTSSFCNECNGIGYKGIANGFQIDILNFICRNCDGIGCGECNHSGVVDWVTHMMGR
ncbi:MAG: hypothetical protein DRI84_09835 [Bacteroidetes bacterium]|nr:MAG: hypothetical protein DRI84_09835 [Bacteroidota bacterium]